MKRVDALGVFSDTDSWGEKDERAGCSRWSSWIGQEHVS